MIEPYIPDTLPLKTIDWERHVTLIGKANAALARYDGILLGMVNPQVLLSPLTTREAVLSSRIEGTQASLEEVLQYEADVGEPRPDQEIPDTPQIRDIHEIINYRRAMGAAVEELQPDHSASTPFETSTAYFLQAFEEGTRTPARSGTSKTTLHLLALPSREQPSFRRHPQF